MPYGTKRVAATYARVILRVISGAEVAENAVIDGLLVPLNADGRRVLEAGQVMVYAGLDEQVLVTVPANTNFTLTFGGQTTSSIVNTTAAPAKAADVQAALAAASSIGANNIDVQGADGGPYTLTFVGALGGQNVGAVTSGTGGVTITSIRDGAAPAAASGQKVGPAASSGVSASVVAGILREPHEFWPVANPAYGSADEPVALWTKHCSFASDQLTSYSGNAAAVQTAMTGAGNGRCAGCTFEP